jgi:hypothetical protein
MYMRLELSLSYVPLAYFIHVPLETSSLYVVIVSNRFVG